MALHEQMNINYILNNLDRELSKLNAETDEIMSEYSGIYNSKDSVNKLRLYEATICNLYSSFKEFSGYWIKYCNTFNEAVSKERDIESIVMNDNKELREKYIEMVNRYNELLKYIASAIDTLNDSNSRVLNTLEEASSSVIYNRATKRKGSSNPNYKISVDTEVLIKEYINNNYKLTSEICNKYGMTYQGIRIRLLERGIWKANKN